MTTPKLSKFLSLTPSQAVKVIGYNFKKTVKSLKAPKVSDVVGFPIVVTLFIMLILTNNVGKNKD